MFKKIILLSTLIITFNLISAEEKLKFIAKDFGSSSFNITIEELEKYDNASKIIIKGYRENDSSADGWVYCMKKRISLENNFKYVMEMNKPVELTLWKKLKSNFQMVEKPDQEIVIINLKNQTDYENPIIKKYEQEGYESSYISEIKEKVLKEMLCGNMLTEEYK